MEAVDDNGIGLGLNGGEQMRVHRSVSKRKPLRIELSIFEKTYPTRVRPTYYTRDFTQGTSIPHSARKRSPICAA
jgi:hypothetical protein